jgi:hypothetical protein
MKVTELKADDGRWEGEGMTPGNLDPYEWAILRRAKGAELLCWKRSRTHCAG